MSIQFSREAVDACRGMTDREWFAMNLTVRSRLPGLREVSREGRVRALLMPAQEAMQAGIEKHRDPVTGGVRVLSAMSRRSGKTSLLSMHGIRLLTEMEGGFRGTIMLHRDDVTRRTRYDFQRTYESLPIYMQHRVDLSNAKEITFPDVDGRLFIATAESRGFGGGEDIHFGLIDEVPRWSVTFCEDLLDDIETAATDDARIYMNGAPECGPEHPFAEKWNKGAYPTIMVEAWMCLEYHVGPRNDWSDLEPLDTATEEHVIRALGAPASYVRWRRARMSRFGGSDAARLLKFRQKYPEYEGHLFQALGANPAVDPDRIQKRLAEIDQRPEPQRVVDFPARKAA